MASAVEPVVAERQVSGQAISAGPAAAVLQLDLERDRVPSRRGAGDRPVEALAGPPPPSRAPGTPLDDDQGPAVARPGPAAVGAERAEQGLDGLGGERVALDRGASTWLRQQAPCGRTRRGHGSVSWSRIGAARRYGWPPEDGRDPAPHQGSPLPAGVVRRGSASRAVVTRRRAGGRPRTVGALRRIRRRPAIPGPASTSRSAPTGTARAPTSPSSAPTPSVSSWFWSTLTEARGPSTSSSTRPTSPGTATSPGSGPGPSTATGSTVPTSRPPVAGSTPASC